MNTGITTGLRQRTKRGVRGQSLAELCGALIVGVPLLLACIDLGFIALAATVNDNVCQDAVRAAASGPPSDNSTTNGRNVASNSAPHNRVMNIIKNLHFTNVPVKVMENPEIFERVSDVPPEDVGGAVQGEIGVATTAMINPPFILRAYCPDGFKLRAQHTMPFTYVVLPKKS